MSTEVVINRIPIVGLQELACIVRVDENGEAFDGDGEPVGGDVPCGEDGNWLVGRASICDRHFQGFCDYTGIDYQGVVDEWRSLL